MSNESRMVGAILFCSLLLGTSAANADITASYAGTSCVQMNKTAGTVSLWYSGTEATNIGAAALWHITSEDIDPRSFPRLASVMTRGFVHAVAFHGFEQDLVLVGGLAPLDVKDQIRAAIAAATAGADFEVLLAGPTDPFNGDSQRNIVNRLSAGGANGVQIEQSLSARTGYWAPIADAVAEVYALQLGQAPVSGFERLRGVLDAVRTALRRASGWVRERV